MQIQCILVIDVFVMVCGIADMGKMKLSSANPFCLSRSLIVERTSLNVGQDLTNCTALTSESCAMARKIVLLGKTRVAGALLTSVEGTYVRTCQNASSGTRSVMDSKTATRETTKRIVQSCPLRTLTIPARPKSSAVLIMCTTPHSRNNIRWYPNRTSKIKMNVWYIVSGTLVTEDETVRTPRTRMCAV